MHCSTSFYRPIRRCQCKVNVFYGYVRFCCIMLCSPSVFVLLQVCRTLFNYNATAGKRSYTLHGGCCATDLCNLHDPDNTTTIRRSEDEGICIYSIQKVVWLLSPLLFHSQQHFSFLCWKMLTGIVIKPITQVYITKRKILYRSVWR